MLKRFILLTIFSIILLTLFHKHLIYPSGKRLIINDFYYYGTSISLIIALIFLNYFAILFGRESNLRKEALNKIEEFIAKEHELVSLGGQAAAAAHSLNTPLSTIKIISQDLHDQLKDKKELKKDLELLVNQVERCSQILKRLSLNPGVEDDFIDQECSIFDYVSEIIKSFEDISNKEFIVNNSQDTNSFKIAKLIEDFSLTLVHIHANNFEMILEKNDLPITLEFTFSKNAIQKEKFIIFHNGYLQNYIVFLKKKDIAIINNGYLIKKRDLERL